MRDVCDLESWPEALQLYVERKRTLKRSISGWTSDRGLPLTLIRPLPFCKVVSHGLSNARLMVC